MREDVGRRRMVGLTEAAYRLRYSYQKAWSHLLSGKLERRKEGDRWLVFEDQLPPEGPREGAA